MLKKLAIDLIRVYQFFSQRLTRNVCRFYPTCSEYTAQSIAKYGVCSGFWRGLKRIIRCRPGSPGGVDLP